MGRWQEHELASGDEVVVVAHGTCRVRLAFDPPRHVDPSIRRAVEHRDDVIRSLRRRVLDLERIVEDYENAAAEAIRPA